MAQLYANGARSVLVSSITSTSTALQIDPAHEGLFPVAAGADWFKVAVEDSSGNIEYIKVQRATGQAVLTVMSGGRAIEDSAKFPARLFSAGAVVQLRLTAADLAASIAHPSIATDAHDASAISFIPSGSIAADDVQEAIQELDSEKVAVSATTAFTRTLLDDVDAATARETLEIPSRYSPGEFVFSASTTAPAGTLATNGGTIGNASSGGTARANADASALFTVLWNSTTNTELVIQTSAGAPTTRGASAAADFAANKRLPLPDIQDGESLVAAVSSAVAARTAGAVLSHSHTVTDPGHFHDLRLDPGGGVAYGGVGPNPVAQRGGGSYNSQNATTGISVDSSGGTKNKAAGLYTRVYIAL
jgi:hypothetical protein